MPCNSVNMKMHQEIRIEVSTDDHLSCQRIISCSVNGWQTPYQRISYAQSTDDRINLKDIEWSNSSWSAKSDGSDTVKGWLDSTAHGNQPTVESRRKRSSLLFLLDIKDRWRIFKKSPTIIVQ